MSHFLFGGAEAKPKKGSKSNKSNKTYRMKRVNNLIKEYLSDEFSRLDYSCHILAQSRLTITDVRVSPDLRYADVNLLIDPVEHTDEVLASLKNWGVLLQRQMAQLVNLKYVPRLRFHPDDHFEKVHEIQEMINKIDYKSE